MEAEKSASTSCLIAESFLPTQYVYGAPLSSVTLVGQSRWPQPCLAVTTAPFTPASAYTLAHWSVSSLVGLNVAGSPEGPTAVGALVSQFLLLQPGSPFATKDAILHEVK